MKMRQNLSKKRDMVFLSHLLRVHGIYYCALRLAAEAMEMDIESELTLVRYSAYKNIHTIILIKRLKENIKINKFTYRKSFMWQ